MNKDENGGLEWVEFEKDGKKNWPDFTTHGFHTRKKIEVRYNDGSEEQTIYQGYGLFGNGLSMFKPITHWRYVK